MQCQYCKGNCRKVGKQKNGAQKFREGIGIHGIARVLEIGINTVLRRIISIAEGIAKPAIPRCQPTFEVDELWTYIGKKENDYWLAYALNKTTSQVVDFVIGKRTKAALKILIDNLLLSGVNQIRTDRLTHYQRLIPKSIHRYGSYCINHI